MVRGKCDILAVPRTVPVKLTLYPYTAHVRPWEGNAFNAVTAMSIAWNPKDIHGVNASVYVVQINGFM
jgi:hypothetical protein